MKPGPSRQALGDQRHTPTTRRRETAVPRTSRSARHDHLRRRHDECTPARRRFRHPRSTGTERTPETADRLRSALKSLRTMMPIAPKAVERGHGKYRSAVRQGVLHHRRSGEPGQALIAEGDRGGSPPAALLEAQGRRAVGPGQSHAQHGRAEHPRSQVTRPDRSDQRRPGQRDQKPPNGTGDAARGDRPRPAR